MNDLTERLSAAARYVDDSSAPIQVESDLLREAAAELARLEQERAQDQIREEHRYELWLQDMNTLRAERDALQRRVDAVDRSAVMLNWLWKYCLDKAEKATGTGVSVQQQWLALAETLSRLTAQPGEGEQK